MNIYESINKVMGDIGAIGKDSKNQMQGFMYRGIDAVMNAINPALVKYKVFVVPEVLEQTREERVNSKGTLLIYSICKVKYTFYAEDGSSVYAVVIGEGMDSGDKATNKAMSIAFKYACFQVFCIPTEEMVDPDAEVHEVKPKAETKKKETKKEEPKAEEPKKPLLISPEQKVALLKEMTRTGMGTESLLNWAKVKTLDDLSVIQFDKTMAQLKTFPNKEDK